MFCLAWLSTPVTGGRNNRLSQTHMLHHHTHVMCAYYTCGLYAHLVVYGMCQARGRWSLTQNWVIQPSRRKSAYHPIIRVGQQMLTPRLPHWVIWTWDRYRKLHVTVIPIQTFFRRSQKLQYEHLLRATWNYGNGIVSQAVHLWDSHWLIVAGMGVTNKS